MLFELGDQFHVFYPDVHQHSSNNENGLFILP